MSQQAKETLAFMVHSIKQFCFGFERLEAVAPTCEPGSPIIAFYLSAVYQHIAVFYLIDKRDQDTMGGAFYKALKRMGFEQLLDPIREVLETQIGATTFGEIVRISRNKAIVHSSYRDIDLDRLYQAANMEDPHVAGRFRETLLSVYYLTRFLAPDLIEKAGYKLADFGISEENEKPKP